MFNYFTLLPRQGPFPIQSTRLTVSTVLTVAFFESEPGNLDIRLVQKTKQIARTVDMPVLKAD